MLDEEQRSMIMELYEKGVNISEIARKVGVSRHSVYRVIHSDIEEDAEIHALKKQLRKAELQGKIEEVRKPVKTRNELAVMKKVIDVLISRVLALCSLSPDWGEEPEVCFYCGEELEYVEETKGGIAFQGFRCNKCRKDFPVP